MTAGRARPVPEAVGPRLRGVDYYGIVASAVRNLRDNTPATRQTVYLTAREIVQRGLRAMRPQLPPQVIDLELLSLDTTIKRIEREARTADVATAAQAARVAALRQPAAPPPQPAPSSSKHGDDPPVVQRRRDFPQIHSFSASPLRLAGVAGVIAAILLIYWIVIGRSSAPRPVAAEVPSAAVQVRPGIGGPLQDISGMDDARFLGGRGGVGGLRAGDDPAATEVDCGSSNTPGRRTQCTHIQLAQAGEAPQLTLTQSRRSQVAAAINYNESGVEYANRGEFVRALRYFSDAVSADPKFADAFVNRGHALVKTGEPLRGMADFNEAIRIDPRNAAAFRARALAWMVRGEETQALGDFSKAIALAETDRSRLPALDVFHMRRSRAGLLDKRGLYDRELADLNAMIEAYWRDPALAETIRQTYREGGAQSLLAWIYRTRGAVHARRQKYEAAIADLSLALQVDPENPFPAIIERARVQEAAGRRSAARADFQRALATNPNSADAKNALARLRGQSS